MKKLLIIVVTTLSFSNFAQNYKFGKVSKEELEATKNSFEPNANAAILYREQKINFVYIQGKGFQQENYIHERIKIYNKEGYDYATLKVRLYDGSNKYEDKITGLKAYTYVLNNGKVEEYKLKSEAIFKEKINSYWKSTNFTMPNINDNCIFEYKYTITRNFLSIDDIPFQKEIPIHQLTFQVSTPEYLKYSSKLNPKSTYYPKIKNSKKNRTITVYNTVRNPRNTNANNVSTGTKLNFIENIISANLSNIPSLKNEILVDNLKNYQAKLAMELKSIEIPGEIREDFSNTWENITNKIYENGDFGSQLKKTNYFKKELDAYLVSKSVNSKEEKMAAIFQYVKSKMTWNGIIGYYSEFGVAKAYKKGKGNTADINLMLTAMLQENKINANPILVSTRDNGIPITPTREGFNYLLTLVNLDGNQYVLDATCKNCPISIIPNRALNWQGRLIKNDGSSNWVSLQPKQNSKESIILNAIIQPDLTIIGKFKKQLTDYFALSFRNKNNNLNQEELRQSFEEGNGAIEISNIELKDKLNLYKPIFISYDYKLSNSIEKIGDKLYFSPLLFLRSKENIFKQESREYPIDFTFPKSYNYIINISLPKDYVIESLPENAKIQFNVSGAEFTYLIKQNGDTLQLLVNSNINKVIVVPNEYPQFKIYFDELLKKENEQIVLRKK